MERAVARPYAAAAFAHACDNDDIGGWSAALAMLAQAATALEDAVAGKQLLPAAEKRELILAVVGDGINEEQKNFVAALTENGRLAALPLIAAHYEELFMQQANIVAVRVESAKPIEDKAAFDDFLKRWQNAAAVRSVYEENPDLIGGVRVYVRDNVLDASIYGRLQKLSAAL